MENESLTYIKELVRLVNQYSSYVRFNKYYNILSNHLSLTSISLYASYAFFILFFFLILLKQSVVILFLIPMSLMIVALGQVYLLFVIGRYLSAYKDQIVKEDFLQSIADNSSKNNAFISVIKPETTNIELLEIVRIFTEVINKIENDKNYREC